MGRQNIQRTNGSDEKYTQLKVAVTATKRFTDLIRVFRVVILLKQYNIQT